MMRKKVVKKKKRILNLIEIEWVGEKKGEMKVKRIEIKEGGGGDIDIGDNKEKKINDVIGEKRKIEIGVEMRSK